MTYFRFEDRFLNEWGIFYLCRTPGKEDPFKRLYCLCLEAVRHQGIEASIHSSVTIAADIVDVMLADAEKAITEENIPSEVIANSSVELLWMRAYTEVDFLQFVTDLVQYLLSSLPQIAEYAFCEITHANVDVRPNAVHIRFV